MKHYIWNRVMCLFNLPFDSIRAWLEWLDAKCWAKEYHPGWVQIATKAKAKRTRKIYRDKIMKAYRGDE